MAKHRVNLNLDEDVYQRARTLLDKFPGRLSVSALVSDLLEEFVTRMEPVIEDGLAGQIASAVGRLQVMNANDQVEIATGLLEMQKVVHNNLPVESEKKGSEVPKVKGKSSSKKLV